MQVIMNVLVREAMCQALSYLYYISMAWCCIPKVVVKSMSPPHTPLPTPHLQPLLIGYAGFGHLLLHHIPPPHSQSASPPPPVTHNSLSIRFTWPNHLKVLLFTSQNTSSAHLCLSSTLPSIYPSHNITSIPQVTHIHLSFSWFMPLQLCPSVTSLHTCQEFYPVNCQTSKN